MNSRGKKVASGAAWLYGSQLISAVAQLGYAAVTSRLVDSDAFGAFAIALAVSGFANLLSVSGLGQAVGRMQDLEHRIIRSLVSYAALIGVASGIIVFLSAPLWALLWGSSAATGAIAATSVLAVTAPLLGLATGLLRRLGLFQSLSIATLATNIGGMLAGLGCVLVRPTAESLVVSLSVAQVALLIFCVVRGRAFLLGFASLKAGVGAIRYSWNLVAVNLVSYLNWNLVKVMVGRLIGLDALGQWNRADTVTTLRIQQVQTALTQAVYPEFRNYRERADAARVVWTDMLVMTAWVIIPVSGLVLPFLPPLTVFLLGDNWMQAAAIAPVCALIAVVQIFVGLLGSAIESLGRFAWIWKNLVAMFLIQCAVIAALFFVANIWVALLGLLFTSIARHGVQIAFVARAGYLHGRRLLANYLIACMVGGLLAAIGALLLGGVTGQGSPWMSLLACALALAVGLTAWLTRERIPALTIARKYGLFRRK